MKHIISTDGLIGDFLGQIPTIQKLSEEEEVLVRIHPESKGLFSLIENDRIRQGDFVGREYHIILNSSEAFQIAAKKNYYMTQAFMEQAGLEVSEVPPKAKLNFGQLVINQKRKKKIFPDYLVSPFARSLPLEQKWPKEKWQQLVDSLPNKLFGLLGNSKYDNENFITGKNVKNCFDMDFSLLCHFYLRSKGLISVVTGTSHLAFHLGVKNILLTNQGMTWGNNPDAIRITDPIQNITVEQVIEKIEYLYDKSNI